MKKSLLVTTLSIILLVMLIPMNAELGYTSPPDYEFDFSTPTGSYQPNITGDTPDNYFDLEVPLTPTSDRPPAAQTSDNSNMITLIALTVCSLTGVIVGLAVINKKKSVN